MKLIRNIICCVVLLLTVFTLNAQLYKIDLAGKINLMYELGILDFLNDRFLNPENGLSDINLAETISQITGELPEQKQMILHLMKKMSHDKSVATFHRSMTAD